MFKPLLSILLSVIFFSTYSKAQDGGQLYELYCSACHGIDGKGAGEGTFPPLAGSDWLEGNPKRAILVILKGLEGPIQVSGKPYNLAMPPHEGSLEKKQILAILNYINNAWGNTALKVNSSTLNVATDEFKDRTKPWTAPELLKLYPLPKQKTPLKNVISRVYKGKWDKMPNFDKLKPESVEEEHSGIIDTSISGIKNHFAIIWEADFIAPEETSYDFLIQSGNATRIILNKATVAEVKGSSATPLKLRNTGSAPLEKGKNHISIEYLENKGAKKLEIRWKKTGSKDWKSLTKQKSKTSQHPKIILTPENNQTSIYRNFIKGTTSRAIGFGFPGELNLAYSADNLTTELLWSGPFIDAGRHWTARGQGDQPPAGEKVITLTQKRFLPESAKFKGYTLDLNGNPTFHTAFGDQTLTDSWKPGETGTLQRTLTLTGGTTPLKIPHNNPDITTSATITLNPSEEKTISYHLK